MQFINVRLLVGNFPAALAFWRDVMQLPLKYGDESIGYAYFDTGGAGVELLGRDSFAVALGEATPAPAPTGRQVVLVFKMDDVDAAYADLVARGARPVEPPRDRPDWGARAAHISDPEGYVVEIYSPLQPTD